MESRALLDFLCFPYIGFCCLLETSVCEDSFRSVFGMFGNSCDCSCCYSSSGIGHIWVMWKQGNFDFTPQVVDEQFVIGSLTNLNFGDSVEVFVSIHQIIFVDIHLLWK